MKAVIQRVSSALVEVDKKVVGSISKGLLVYLGISKNFTEEKFNWMINKVLNFRIWNSERKGFDLSVSDIKGEILVISQFTLYGDCSKGLKPNFRDSQDFDKAEEIYNRFIEKLKESGLKVESGVFGAKMKVNSVNEGPVTLIIEKN